MVGLFALHSDKREGGPLGFFFDPNTVAGLFSSPNDYTQVSDQKVATDSFAAFGEANFSITPMLKLTAGARAAVERKSGVSTISYSIVDPGLFPGHATLFPHLECDHAQGDAVVSAGPAFHGLCHGLRGLQERRLRSLGFRAGPLVNVALATAVRSGNRLELRGRARNSPASTIAWSWTPTSLTTNTTTCRPLSWW